MSSAAIQSEQTLLQLLGAALGVKPESIRARVAEQDGAALVFEAEGHRFVLEAKSASDAASIDRAIRHLQAYLRDHRAKAIGVVAVPYMGEVGHRMCQEAGLGWLDLAGNAFLKGPGLRVDIQGRPNRFRKRGRPADVFAPKSSRVARWLLLHPEKSVRQGELAEAVGLGRGFVSRIVKQLEQRELVLREDSGAVRVRDAGLLLDAWRERYDFSRHEARRGVVAARSGDEALRRLASVFESEKIQYAATGLGAAWLLTHFAGFRRLTIYLKAMPSASLLEKIGFREEEAGANVWLILPNDEGVILGDEQREGVRCVSPVQAYLDLKGHPERAEEAAERLRKQHLNWSRHA
jgi:DNA-binding MarR family transcriptional regulator